MAWTDLASNECPTKDDINARLRSYLSWQSRYITMFGTDYTVNPGGAPWNYLFIWPETISPYIPIPSCLLIPKADSGSITYSIKAYSTAYNQEDTITITFTGSNGDIRIQKTKTYNIKLNYIVFW